MQFFFFILASNPVNTAISMFVDEKEVPALVDVLHVRHLHCVMTAYRFSTSFRSNNFAGKALARGAFRRFPSIPGTGDLPRAPAVPTDPGWGQMPPKWSRRVAIRGLPDCNLSSAKPRRSTLTTLAPKGQAAITHQPGISAPLPQQISSSLQSGTGDKEGNNPAARY